jgi:hypothetical protein
MHLRQEETFTRPAKFPGILRRATMAQLNYRKRRFEAGFDRKEGNTCLYRITEFDEGIVRTFTATISARQQSAALKGGGNNTDERQVERWCQIKRDRLPANGGRVAIDLNEIRKD